MKTTTRTRACISKNLHTAFMFKSSIRIDLSFLLFLVLHLDLSKLYLSLYLSRAVSLHHTHTHNTHQHTVHSSMATAMRQ